MLSVGFKSDKGMCRGHNEDSVFVLPDQQLYIVADGVGGHNAGDVASRMAVESIAAYVTKNPVSLAENPSQLKEFFMSCISFANENIFARASVPGEGYGMATTCVLCYIRDDQAYVVNVGDSRAYLIREGKIGQVTEDHSCVQEMIRSGLITEEEAKDRPDRNMITRALGGEPGVSPDFFSFKLYAGDTILLCSDGLYGEVSSERLAELCTRYKTMHRLSRQLVDEANRNGGKDNISVVCIRVQ